MSQRRKPGGSRAVVYVRFSHKEQETIEDQERRCRAYAEAKDWTVVQVVSDKGISAWSGKDRPGWTVVEAMVERGDVDVVVVFQVWRAARNVGRLHGFIKRCEERDVVFASASEGVDTSTAMGRLMATIVGALAELESEIKSERVLLGLERVRGEGRWSGGRVPFGFRQEDGKLVPDEAEAALIREAASRVVTGEGLKTIARDWTQRGLKTKRGSDWSGTSLRDVLAADWHEGTILTHADRERVLKVLEGNRADTTPRGDRYLLTGILRCAECNEPMVGQPRQGVRRYRCKSPHRTVIPSDVVEQLVLRRCAVATREIEGIADTSKIEAELLKRMNEAERALQAWARKAAEAGLSPSEIRAGREPLAARRDAIQQQIEACAERPRIDLGKLLQWGKNPPEPNPAEDRVWVEGLIESATVARQGSAPSDEERVTIVWKDGVEFPPPRYPKLSYPRVVATPGVLPHL